MASTVAPTYLANWIAATLTPLPAAWINTVSPAPSEPTVRSPASHMATRHGPDSACPAAFVVVTGDLTNLALEPEFEAARAMIERLGMHPSQVSVVPGNHDLYTEGSSRSRRFGTYFEKYITSDLDLAVELPGGRFPFVRLRDDLALIGLSSALPRLPLVASGRLGEAQRRALREALDHPEVRSRVPVVLCHHPIVDPLGRLGPMMRGLEDLADFRDVLDHGRDVLALRALAQEVAADAVGVDELVNAGVEGRAGDRQRKTLRRVLVDRADLDAFIEARKRIQP